MVLIFKVALNGVRDPEVWRRIEVPADFSFNRMATVIRDLFGWDDAHLWQYATPETGPLAHVFINTPADFDPVNLTDARHLHLDQIFSVVRTMTFTFGGDWTATITLEGTINERRERAVCTDGAGVNPPGDCGGPDDYASMKAEVLAGDAADPALADVRRSLGLVDNERYDPTAFTHDDVERITRRLAAD